MALLARTDDLKDHILLGTGGALTTISDLRGKQTGFGTPAINSSGQTVFGAFQSDNNEKIYRGDGTVLEKIAATRTVDDQLRGYSVNDAGLVAFEARLSDDGGLYIGNPRRTRPVYTFSSSDFVAGGDFFSTPALGDSAVAFTALRGTAPDGVFRQTIDGELTTIAEVDASMYKFRGVSMNAAGEVAFTAFIEDDLEAIMVGSGGPLRTVVDTAGPFMNINVSTVPSINDSGTVAFTASLDDLRKGLFIGPDPDADRVVLLGDALAGSKVKDLAACGQSLNDVGQLAFTAELADGRAVIVRADPA